jgi:hypothetical protein
VSWSSVRVRRRHDEVDCSGFGLELGNLGRIGRVGRIRRIRRVERIVRILD